MVREAALLLSLWLPTAIAPGERGSATVTTVGSAKCDKPGHERLCEHLKQYTDKDKDLTWRSAEDEKRVFSNLYDAYHEDRGNITKLFAGTALLGIIQAHPPEKYRRTLEGGPGSCVLLREMQKRGYDVAAHEISSVAIKKYCPGLPVTQGLLQRMPYESASFDLLYTVDCLEHIPPSDIPRTFKELRRVAKAGAPLFFNLGHCSKLAGGVAHSSIIHVSGICDTYPRSWWDEQLRTAGFEEYPESDQQSYEARAKLRQGRRTEVQKKAGAKNPSSNWHYNDRPHAWFFYRAV